jgi:hypothetical protein
MYIHAYIHTHTYIHTYTNTHTHTHTYTHTNTYLQDRDDTAIAANVSDSTDHLRRPVIVLLQLVACQKRSKTKAKET